MVRSALAVLVGYILFALSALAFFKLSGQPPHQAAPAPIMAGSVAVGMLFALLGGYVAAWLAGRRPVAHGLAVGVVLALGATLSLLFGKGAIWSQVAALGLMAPCAVLGGWLRAKRVAGA